MPLICYLDETGDHSLELVDKDFPAFVLTLLACDVEQYADRILPAFYRFKRKYFDHEGVILHSRDIRKTLGPFSFLKEDGVAREALIGDLTKLMNELPYTLFASVIKKQPHKDRYGMWASNPYHLATKFVLERLLPMLEASGQGEVCLVAESRGPREDDELRKAFLSIVTYGTEYISGSRFKAISFRLKFVSKDCNVIGTQMADLAGYPIGRHALDPQKSHVAYPVLQKKFYVGPGWVRGLKVFP